MATKKPGETTYTVWDKVKILIEVLETARRSHPFNLIVRAIDYLYPGQFSGLPRKPRPQARGQVANR